MIGKGKGLGANGLEQRGTEGKTASGEEIGKQLNR